jgi:hypothetical protein
LTIPHELYRQSINIVVNDLLKVLQNLPKEGESYEDKVQEWKFPPSIEECVAPNMPNFNTLAWALYQLANSLRSPVVLPRWLSAEEKERLKNPSSRRTVCTPLILSNQISALIRAKCRSRGVTVSHLLGAVMAMTSSYALQQSSQKNQSAQGWDDLTVRFLLAVGLRPFAHISTQSYGKKDFTGGTVACAAGAIDYLLKVSREALADDGDFHYIHFCCIQHP